MGYPSKRDRIVNYWAEWSDEVNSARPICLKSVEVLHDCINQKASARGFVRLTMKAHDRKEVLFTLLNTHLIPCGMHVFFRFSGENIHGDGMFELRELDRTQLKFNSPQQVVRWINGVATVFDQSPVARDHLTITIRKREVWATLPNKEREWMDEADWLATTVAREHYEAVEEQIVKVCQSLHEEGQGIRIVLKPSLDMKTAIHILNMYGGSFSFTNEVKQILDAVGKPGWEPRPITVTLDYCKPLTTGIRS